MGIMGHGIAQVTAEAGLQVVCVDSSAAAVEKGVSSMRSSLLKVGTKRADKRGADGDAGAAGAAFAEKVMGRVHAGTDMGALSDCDVVIEAVVETLDAKKALFSTLGGLVGPATVLASNTSSLPIGAMAPSSGRPGRFLGLHFFSPVQVMPLLEVVRGSETEEAVFAQGMAFAQAIGKTAVACVDTPGFIVNRLLVPYLAQAIAMVERGHGSVKDVDNAMKLGAGYPMGPLTLADYVGLDTCLFILQGWVRDYPNEPAFFVPKLLEQLVAQGHFGRKSGQGFYTWSGAKPGDVAYSP
jgi:3-hydroxyacyl-CoA dehydrogenase